MIRKTLSLSLCGIALAACGAGQSTRSSAPASTGPTTPTATGASGCPSSGGYVAEAFCLVRQAGTRNHAIDTDCGPLLSSGLSDPGGRCRSDIDAYATFLRSAQSDLHLQDLPSVPANDRAPAAYLGRAVGDDLAAAQQATAAIAARNYIGFLRAWGLHAKAGRELTAAGAVFSAH